MDTSSLTQKGLSCEDCDLPLQEHVNKRCPAQPRLEHPKGADYCYKCGNILWISSNVGTRESYVFCPICE